MIEFLNIKNIVARILNDKERLGVVRVVFVSGAKLCVRKFLFRIVLYTKLLVLLGAGA